MIKRAPSATEEASPLIYLSPQYIQAKEYLEAIVGSTSDAIVTTDLRGRIIYFSPGAERLYGLGFHEALGMAVYRLYSGGQEEARAIQKHLMAEGALTDYETVVEAKGGLKRHISMTASLLRDRSGKVIGTLGISKDISRRVELERKLRELSITDNLTGLYNQRHYHERSAAEVERAGRQGHKLSLLLIDLDRFKEANDRWGHLEGDRILKEVAGILRSSVRRSVDAAFRYGGDEFIVLFPGLGKSSADAVARRMRLSAAEKDWSEIVSLSIGVATLEHKDSAQTLLKRADSLMYASKKRRRRHRPQASLA